jgi:hypothetical protein
LLLDFRLFGTEQLGPQTLIPHLKISSNEMLLDADAVRLVLKETAGLVDQQFKDNTLFVGLISLARIVVDVAKFV